MVDKKKIESGVVLILVSTIFTSLAQLFLKFGANKFESSLPGLVTNPFLILGLLLYGVSGIFLIYALKHGELSALYPFFSLSYVWVPILALIFLGEHMVFLQWSGIVILIIGLSFIRRGVSSG